ncbi:MAG: hypothetical protein PHD88_04800 [Firmicutes bacterium]|nr:hypothetical protein [Bacillota bacterium]MDD4693712.1 hypothetical protein [Bacillota bacterium]
MFLVIFLVLSISIFAESPLDVWESLKVTENIPIAYDEIVVITEPAGVSVRYFNVFRENSGTIRREETGYYSDEIIQVELKKDYTDYLWLENIPYVYESVAKEQLVEWMPEDVSKGMFEGQEVSILTLSAKALPFQTKQYINLADMTIFKEELYQRGRLVQIRERRNIRTNPEFRQGAFDLPMDFIVLRDRKAWERALVGELLLQNDINDVYYPEWLPDNWVLIDVNIDEYLDENHVVYRFHDGSEYYSLFISPLKSMSDRKHVSVLYKDSMGVFQLMNQGFIITLVGRLKEKDAFRIIDSLAKLDPKVDYNR